MSKKHRDKRTHVGVVKVGPIEIDVFDVATNKHDGTDYYGYIKHSESTILLDASMKPSRRRATLFHEALHAVSNEYAIGLSEDQVKKLETGLLILFNDNPDLLR